MSREIYVFRDGKLVPKSEAPPKAGFFVVSDYAAYECPITGKPVEGRAAHRENLKQHGCRVLERGEREAFVRNRDRAIEDSTRSLVDRMFKG